MQTHIKPSPLYGTQNIEEHRQLLLDLGMSPAMAQAMIDIDTQMGHFRRSMSRHELGRIALRDLQLDIDVNDMAVISAIESGPSADGEITVGLIAERLAIDPSRASRIVADAVDKGIIRRVASQADARRIGIELTETGRSHAAAVRRYKWNAFAEVLGNWPEEELVTFARLYEKFGTRMAMTKARREKP